MEKVGRLVLEKSGVGGYGYSRVVNRLSGLCSMEIRLSTSPRRNMVSNSLFGTSIVLLDI